MVRPSARAVFRLMTNSNFMGCSTGRSAGLAPLRILSTKAAARRKFAARFCPYVIKPPASANSRSGKMAGSRLLAAKATMCVLLSKSMPSASVMRALGRSARHGFERHVEVGRGAHGDGLQLETQRLRRGFNPLQGAQWAGFAAFQRTATRGVCGAASLRSSSRLPLSSGVEQR